MTTNATQSADRLESLERRSLIGGVSRFSIQPHAQHPAIAPSGLGTLFYPEIRRACAPLPSRRPNGRRIRPHRCPLLTEILIANLELEFELSYRKLSPLRISNRKYFAIMNRTWPPHPQHACYSLQISPNCTSNRDTAIRTPSNFHHCKSFQISNRDKNGDFASATPHPDFNFASVPQIDHAAPRAYTYIPPKEKPSWKIPSY